VPLDAEILGLFVHIVAVPIQQQYYDALHFSLPAGFIGLVFNERERGMSPFAFDRD
jgi:hypothetical protein